MTIDSSDPKERREHHRVRAVFERCCATLAPIIAENSSVGKVSSFGMSQILTGHFPQLTSAEIHIVILTVEKMQRENRLQALLAKKK